MKNACNRCCKCGFEWEDKPGALARHKECPSCNSFYWVWLNYKTA